MNRDEESIQEESTAKKGIRAVTVGLIFIWVAQITLIVLKLVNIITTGWGWVLAVSWVSIIFWFVMIAGTLLVDRLLSQNNTKEL
jgi:hypothetical protein